MQRAEVLKLMALVSSEYGDRFHTSPEKIDLWLNILGHANFNEGTKAITKILGSAAKFPPTVGEINCKILEERTGAATLDWATEWQRALKAAANSNYNAEAEAGKLAAVTLDAIGGIHGLKEIALAPSGDLMAIRAQFRQRFEMLSTRKVEREFRDFVEGTAKTLIDGGKDELLEM